MTNTGTRTLFLPGAGASADFWKPVAQRTRLDCEFLAWPGLGDEPAHPAVGGIDDLVSLVLDRMAKPTNIVAQSMGGVVALKAALAAPEKVCRLVLTATSGGVAMSELGGSDWRADYYRAFPHAAKWIGEPIEDLSARMTSITVPALLLWGDRDPISPVAVAERLRRLLPDATLHIIKEADHDLARTHVDLVAPLIEQHLTAS